MVVMISGKESSVHQQDKENKEASSVLSTTVASPITATFSDIPALSTSQTMSPSTTPPISPATNPPQAHPKEATTSNKKSSKLPTKCPLEKCLLCSREQPLCLMRSSTWPAIMRVVFYTLKYNNPEKEFFNLKDDVYSVMLFHWNKLAIHKKSASNWKKHIQDMLSHSKDIFESGLEIYGQNGYWRLKVNTDPWTLSGKTRRSPKKALNMKRSLEDTPMAEQMPRRPFIPYIAKEPGKYTETCHQPVSYVFINEHSSPPVPVPNVRKEEPTIAPLPTSALSSPNPFMANPFGQRITFIPLAFQQGPQSSPVSFSSPQIQALHLQQSLSPSLQQSLSPSLQSFLSHPRLAVSLPSSRLPSPQRSRSPSPILTQSLPTSPRGLNHLSYISYSPLSAPASPISSPRASPYPIPKRKSVTQPPSPRSRPMSPNSRPRSPRSEPISPHNSPPSSPRIRGRAFRGLRSPSPSPQSPLTPISPHSPVQEDSALDSLRNTFEQFHWHTQPQQTLGQAQMQMQVQGQGLLVQTPVDQSLEQHQIAFNLFAAAKPANPCDVSFLLNE